MTYTSIEKKRLEEYQKNVKLANEGKSSISLSSNSNNNNNINLPVNNQKNNSWFKQGQGNFIQNTLGTIGDVGINLAKGADTIGQGVKNTIASAFINAASPLTRSEKLLTGKDHLEEWRTKATQDVLNYNPISDKLSKAEQKVDKYSALGNKSDSIASGVGYYGGMLALEALGIPWQATASFTSYGSGYDEAIKEGASREQAVLYSLGSAAAEVGSEYIFSGVKLPGTGKVTEEIVEQATNKIRNKVVRELAKFGINTIGEGIEEVISGTASEIVKRLAYSDKWDYSKKDAFDDFLSGVLVSAITGAVVPGQNNLINNLQEVKGSNIETQKENESIATVNDIVNTEQGNNNNSNINTTVDADTINTRINEVTEQISEYRELQQENRLTQQQQQQMTELQTELNNLQNQLSELSNTNNQDNKNIMPITVNELTANENSSNLNSSRQILPLGNDLTRNSINTQETTKTLPARNLNLIESARINNIDPNSEPIVSINKMLSDRGINSRFDANLFSDSNANAIWMTNVNENGETVREIIFNPNADTKQLIQEVAVHELYHDMVAGGNADLLADLIESFNMRFPDFQKARQELAKTYSKVYQNSNNFEQAVNEEVVANILAQKLGSQEYINRLVHEKPSIAKQIYDFVIDKLNRLNRLVGYRSEKIFWEDVKNKFEKAYREEYKNNNASDSTRYMITGIKGVKNGVKADAENQWALDSYNRANEMAKQGYTNEQIRQRTWWFQDQNGDWKFEISDEDANLIKNVEKNKSYKLGEILEHNGLFEIYPKAKNIKVKFTDIEPVKDPNGKLHELNGRINKITNTITINNKLISKGSDAVLNTLIHEIQHYAQKVEKFQRGTSVALGESEYIKNLGEKEARDTSARRKMTEEQREQILPIAAKYKQSTKNVAKNNFSLYNNDIEGTNETDKENKGLSKENVRSDILHRVNEELDNSSFSYKQKQLDIILNSNPVNDDYHTWIRTIDDIKTLQETIEDSDWSDYDEYNPDLTKQDIEKAIESGKITVYSSYPIEQGTFVSPSRMEAESYSGDGKIYSKEINIEDAAWIDPTQAQYAKVADSKSSVKQTDNEGRALSKEQQKYFKDSKVRDENGNLEVVYHTTTDEVAQFNEFNPVGTEYYRFGDQVVNYYTNSKDMSGSYASQDYKMADTKKISSTEELNNYLDELQKETGNTYTVEQRNDGKYIVSQDKQISREARDFIETLSESEKKQMLDNIYEDEIMKDSNYARVFSWNYFDKELQNKYKKLTDKYLGTADTVAIQQEVMKYLESPAILHEDTRLNGEVVNLYDSKSEMLKNIKSDIQKSDWSKNSRIQYEGYANITNPYVIDAEERNWNQVVQQSNEFIDELESRVPEDVKNNLTRLYNESANRSNEARDNYEKYQKIINEIDNEYLSPELDDDIRKMNHFIKRVGIDNVTALSNGTTDGLGVSTWYNIAEVLEQDGVIGQATSSFIIDEFRLPENIKEWIDMNLYGEIDYKGVKNLKELYDKNKQAYEEFDKYRMPNSYFLEKISGNSDSEGFVDLGEELEDIFETRAEIKGADVVGEEIAQAASVAFSKPELIRLWGTSKTTNDIVKEVITSNADGLTNYDGVIIKNVYDYGGRSATETKANNVYVTFNSNQFKAADNLNPTKDSDIRYSQNNSKWQEYLDKHYTKEGTGQKLSDLKKIKEKVKEVTSDNKYLTDDEAKELYVLENLPFELEQQEIERLEYLKNKEKGYKVKFPELKKNITYKDIKSDYAKYRDTTGFDSKLLKTAKQFVPGYRNTEKRTKQQWLNVANFIGSNIKTNSSQELTKYAIQSWFSVKPNTKETLNRQGQKYVKFTIEDWVNEIYKAAGVGSLVKEKNILPVRASIDTKGEAKTDNTQLIPIDSSKLKKTMNPTEISKLTKQDANTTPILPTRKVQTGKGESSFARNISEKTNMLSEDSKKSILSSNEVNYYKQVTNEESLNKAFDKINKGGQSEVYSWMTKNSENATSVDIAEGWILLKQYQDQIQNETDTSKKDDLNRSMVEVAKKMREMGTKAGQTVQAFNIMNRLTPEGMVYYAQSELQEAYEKMSKNKTKEWIDANRENFELTPEDTKFIMNNMEEIRDMEDGYDKRVKLAEIQKLMTDKLPPEKGAALKSWMRISMLFNPKTQVRNVAGNALIAPINYFGDLFSSYADKIIAKKTGVRTTGNMNVNAILKGMKEGAYQSTNDYKKGINTKDMEGNRFEITEGKSFNDKTVIGKSLNRVEALLNYVMDAGDRVFSQASFENSIQNQMILNNTTEITQDMIDIARAESLQRTWNDNNEYTRFVLNVRKGLNKLSFGDYGLGDVLIPFAKTPANLTKAIIDYSPAGLIKTMVEGKNLKNSLSNGQYNAKMQHKFVQDLGKATAGTMLYVLGYALAKAGITSGKSDDDKDTANFIKNTLGISSYSINIGGKTFTYDWAQPLAAPLSITANIVNSRNNKEQALLEGIIGSLDSAGSILLEQSFLQSINDVLTDNDGFVSGLINSMLDLPARAVPTFSKQVADLVDGIQRTTFEYGKPVQTAINKVKAKIPFLSKTLSPTVDTMGREIQKYGGKNNIFNVFLNPANINTENISTSAAEIYRLYNATGDKTIMPRVAPYYINKNGEKIIMDSKQRAEYQKIAGNIIELSVKELVNDSKYINLSDTEKSDMINKIVNYAYNKARKDVLNIEMSDTYNKINSYTDDGGNVADYYLNKEEIDYSYQNPEKYKTIKQITTYDKYLTYQDEINNIKERYESTNQRKSAIINYVNSLDLSIAQKAMLIRMNYSSFTSYDKQIIEYINNQDLTKKEKEEILSKLGFKIKDGRVYTK